jgi:hypothetical protein
MKFYLSFWNTALLVFIIAMLLLGVILLTSCGSSRESVPALPSLPGSGSGGTTPKEQTDPLTDARQRVADAEGLLAKAKAELEQRVKQEQERSIAAWQWWTRLVAGLGIPLALALGALGAWFGLGRVALPIAGALVVACVGLLAFGEALPWLRVAGPIAALLALLGVGVVIIVRQRRALGATARLGDALEAGIGVAEAKAGAKAAQVAAGAWKAVQQARGRM